MTCTHLNSANSGCRVTMFVAAVGRSVDFLRFGDYPEAEFLLKLKNKMEKMSHGIDEKLFLMTYLEKQLGEPWLLDKLQRRRQEKNMFEIFAESV